MEDINILFLGGAKRVSLAERFQSAGLTCNRKVNIVSYELSKEVPISCLAKVIVGRNWNDTEVINDLLNVVSKHSIDIILPFNDDAIPLCSKLKELTNCFVPVSTIETVEIMNDKFLSDSWFKENGILTAEFTGDFPSIAKPRFGAASKGIEVINTTKEHLELSSSKDTEYLFQRFITGKEYTVDCYINQKSVLIGAVPRVRIEVVGGEVRRAMTVNHDKILNIVKSIIDTKAFLGPINIQFLEENTTGEIFVIEINPRFGGGVINSIEAGFNTPLFVIQEFLGIEVKPESEWKTNVLMMRVDREVFLCK